MIFDQIHTDILYHISFKRLFWLCRAQAVWRLTDTDLGIPDPDYLDWSHFGPICSHFGPILRTCRPLFRVQPHRQAIWNPWLFLCPDLGKASGCVSFDNYLFRRFWLSSMCSYTWWKISITAFVLDFFEHLNSFVNSLFAAYLVLIVLFTDQ